MAGRYPLLLIFSVSPARTLLNLKRPDREVIAAPDADVTLTPDKGARVILSFTIPLISCACVSEQENNSNAAMNVQI